MMASKCSLDNMLRAVLAPANTEQNQVLPPHIYDDMYNTVTSLLINALAKEFPNNPLYVDMLQPFLKAQTVMVVNGYIPLPADYRNFLDVSYNMKGDGCGECGDEIPEPMSVTKFQESVKKRGCLSIPVTIVSQAEWDERTRSTYKFPDYENAIGCFFGANSDGQNQIKICPYDIAKVEIRYLIQENNYQYGYTLQPDDTYIYNVATTTESQWTSAAFNHIYRGISALFAAYTKNPEMRDFTMILNQKGIL